ncbi:hypothetical protein DWB77_01280 [Streptomyces hundungensis]|uniref:DUF2243 domain-containing protein n=1 Tax=Streptomyces hundungensis TaxID=1077946 RepID=A0A387HE02_9ACTN|nr:DUF2243 domain-containing protein [Streptomyces hundungensis]AYG79170.1 hypothetical protein DWB77_01280 [Streptomyces hundungensis]
MVTPSRAPSPSRTTPGPVRGRPLRARSVWSGVLIGVGIAAFVDETVFHQLLHWHHFYDRSTPGVGLVSDGLFHAFGWFAVVIGLFMVADLRHRAGLVGRALAGGVLTGTGAFQLYDGTVQHKLMGLHQIRYHVDLTPYDLTWNILAVVFLGVGVVLLRSARSSKSLSAPGR